MKTFVAVNPASAGGRTGRLWPRMANELEAAIGRYDHAFSAMPGGTSAIVRDAVAAGATRIIAVGGDGTINEAINGLCDGEAPPRADIVFGTVTSGTGGDFRRTFGIGSSYRGSIARLRDAKPSPIDLGLLVRRSADGQPDYRWFNNIASFGFSGEVIRAVNEARWSRMFGGKVAFLVNSMRELRRFEGRQVELLIDGVTTSFDICTVAICNGRYFGGGMMIAPNAEPDDGLFDVIVVLQNPPLPMLDLRLLYRGSHIGHRNVRVFRGARIVAHALSNRPVRLEVEGEAAGLLPAEFRMVPRALNFLS
jgi:diacylglycerol kinase (ATP)